MNKQLVTVPHALIVLGVFASLAFMVWLKVPEAAVALMGATGTVIGWLKLNGAKSTDDIVREASLRPPPPTGQTEVIEVVVPKYNAPNLQAPIPREEPKDVP